MEAKPLTPVEIFQGEKRYLVPLFQRPYVWTRDDQWEPLWRDVQRLADELLDTGQTQKHFLGAIVIEQLSALGSYHHMWNVIDGQQRLTTLQVLLDATEMVVAERGSRDDSQALRLLITNSIGEDEQRFKVWPTNRDREAFTAAMDDARPVPEAWQQTPLVQAHDYFRSAITEWAGDESTTARLHALTAVLREHLTVVGINLDPSDNAQVIFETLNFRGAPLLAADLVKNHLFQRAQAQHKDVERLYARHWEHLDEPYWRQDVRRGRLNRPRIDVFLSHWLSMRLGREIGSERVFSEFSERVSASETDVERLMRDLADDARSYRAFMEAPLGSADELVRHRLLDVLDSNAVMPVVLWLLVHDMTVEQRGLGLACLESWLTRRALLRLGTKDLTHLVVELVKELNASDAATAGSLVQDFLLRQDSPARHWPDDDYLRGELTQLPAYRTLRRPVNRMVLEAAEDHLRAHRLEEGQRCPRDLSVEHVMPQSWQANWPLPEDADESDAESRSALVQTLGNLTLVTGAHNSSLSNRPWRAPDGRGKRDYLLANSTLKSNADIAQQHPDEWTDDDIRERTQQIIDAILATWPRPASSTSTRSILEASPMARGTAGNAPDGPREHRAPWTLGDVLETFAGAPEIQAAVSDLAAGVRAMNGTVVGRRGPTPAVNLQYLGTEGQLRSFLVSAGDPDRVLRINPRPTGASPESARQFDEALRTHFPTAVDDESGRRWLTASHLTAPGAVELLLATAVLLIDDDTQRWWGIHNDRLQFDELKAGGFVSIGWDDIGDLSELVGDREGLKAAIRTAHPDAGTQTVAAWAGIMARFAKLRPSDRVVAADKQARTLNIGEVSGPYWFESDAAVHRHRVPVRWLATGLSREQFSQETLNELGSALTLFRVRRAVGELERGIQIAT